MVTEEQLLEVSAIFTYKGRKYAVVDYRPGQYRMKDPSDGNWHDAVEYCFDPSENTTDEEEDMAFVRRADDFMAKFEEVTE
jgi:hypothetical protein